MLDVQSSFLIWPWDHHQGGPWWLCGARGQVRSQNRLLFNTTFFSVPGEDSGGGEHSEHTEHTYLLLYEVSQ